MNHAELEPEQAPMVVFLDATSVGSRTDAYIWHPFAALLRQKRHPVVSAQSLEHAAGGKTEDAMAVSDGGVMLRPYRL